MKQNYKLLLSYDGSRYFGFERQKDQELTIQGKLEAVLTAMPRNDTDRVETFSAGRTDAGVHARGMCCHVFLDTDFSEEEIQNYCNHYLPEDIAVHSLKKASERFHARYLATGKIYRYSCHTGKNKEVFERKYLYHLEEEPDIAAMQKAAEFLIGEKDFKSFCGNPKMKKSTVRKIFNIDIKKNGSVLRFYFPVSMPYNLVMDVQFPAFLIPQAHFFYRQISLQRSECNSNLFLDLPRQLQSLYLYFPSYNQ